MTVPLDRRRAAHALEAVRSIGGEAFAGDYKGYVKGVPAMIMSLGFGQTLALLLDRGGDDAEAGQGGRAPAAYHRIFDHLTAWLFVENPLGIPLGDRPIEGRAGRMAAVTGLAQRDYMVLQAEALAYLEWLKKFANAFLTATPGGGGEGQG